MTQALRTDVPVLEEYVDQFRAELVEGGLHRSADAVAKKKPLKAIGTGVADVGGRLVRGLEIPNVCDLIYAAPFES